MVFVRLSGCNLACPFCDTDHRAGRPMTAEELVQAVRAEGPCKRVCLTGGEPLLQADRELVDALHLAGYKIHLETNGTRPVPEGVDWVTLSPKEDFVTGGKVVLERADELKLVLAPGTDPAKWAGFPASWHFLQPCAAPDGSANTAETVAYIQAHPQWRLSLQTHKLLNIR
jgi:organic radical activating enzyme